jgi:hypothetical protein
MKSDNQSLELIRELRFESNDFFNQQIMLEKLDRLIRAWGEELLRSQYIDGIPDSEDSWLSVLERDIHWTDLKDPWDAYLISSLIFFVLMREDIKRDFLLQPYNIQGQRLERWLWRLKRYLTPLSRDVVTQFCICYSLSQERKPIRVRYKEFRK